MFFNVSFPLLYYKRMPLCSVYGILNVVVYFDRTKLINHDSSMKLFVEVEDKLFRDKVSCDWSRDGHHSDRITTQNRTILLEGRVPRNIFCLNDQPNIACFICFKRCVSSNFSIFCIMYTASNFSVYII